MLVRFWGVRGSVPWATPAAMGFGCNTPCVEVRDDRSGSYLILDGGSGLVGLSESFAGEPRPTPLLLSHYHWDHTHGLPYFGPFYSPGWKPEVFAPALTEVPADWIQSMFRPPNFPVPFAALPNRPTVTVIEPSRYHIGGFPVNVHPLSHPGGAFAYRVHGPTGDLCYVTDHEFGNPAVDEPLLEFCRNCTALISDAHFTPDELLLHRGWGHGDWRQVAEFASQCGARRLFLFHHKPGRPDVELTQIVGAARRVFPSTDAACEGLAFNI